MKITRERLRRIETNVAEIEEMLANIEAESGDEEPDRLLEQIRNTLEAKRKLERHTWLELEPQPLPDFPDPKRVVFKPPFVERSYRRQNELQRQGNITIAYLNHETGLPHQLHGKLQEPQPRAAQAAEKYLKENELLIVGMQRGTQLRRVREIRWPDGITNVRFVQTNAKNIPVYGAYVVCTFDAEGGLRLLSSTLYPVTAKEITGFNWKGVNADNLEKIMQDNVPSKLGWGGLVTPTKGLRQEVQPFGQKSNDAPASIIDSKADAISQILSDRWILPHADYLGKGSGGNGLDEGFQRSEIGWRYEHKKKFREPIEIPGRYRPVLRVPFRDKHGDHWLALLDVEEEDKPILQLTRDQAHSYLKMHVFLDGTRAVNGETTSKSLYGVATNGRPYVSFSGDSCDDPVDRPYDPRTDNSRDYVKGNLLYHIRSMQVNFNSLFADVVQQIPSHTPQPPTSHIPINLVDVDLQSFAQPSFKFATGELSFPIGLNQNYSIQEPAFDSEVITHELTHAMFHYYMAHLVQLNHNTEEIACRSLDEGFAFYFPCLYFDQPEWAQFAYKDWMDKRKVDTGPLMLEDAYWDDFEPTGDPVYSVGMWWTRLLWELYQELDLDEDYSFNYKLVQALSAIAGLHANTNFDQLNKVPGLESIFQQLGNVIRAHMSTETAQQKVQDIYQNRNISL